MASLWTVVGRPVAALALAATATACSPHPRGDGDPAVAAEPNHVASSALSAFLAGRFAQQVGDTRAAAEYYAQSLIYDPDNLELMQRAFTLMVAEGRFDDAAPLADRLLAFDGDAPIPLLVSAVHAARQGHYQDAEARFAAIPKKGFNTFLSPLLAAWARAGQGQAKEAVDMLAPLASAPGVEGMFAFHTALLADLEGNAKTAEKNYTVALSGPLTVRTVEAAGSFYQRAGKPERARALYDQYEAEHPETMLFDGRRLLAAGSSLPSLVPDARAGIAQAMFDTASLMRQGNALDLALIFSRLTLAAQPDFVLAKMMVGDILAAQKRPAEANAMYGSIPKDSPAHAYGRLRIAVNLDQMGDTEGALKALDALAAEGSLDAQVTKGDLLRSKQRFPEAAQAYGAAIGKLPAPGARHWLLFFSRGIAHERSGEWERAEADFRKALELKPDQPDVMNYLGYSWVDQGRNLDEGRAMIEKAVQLRPRDGAIVDSLGWALYRMGDYHGAVKHLERAVELRPEDPTINDHLGDAYWQVGRIQEAGFQWQRALTLDPEPKQRADIEEKIRSGEVPAKPLVQ